MKIIFIINKSQSCIEKAVYPIGTIRNWKGKDYVKVSPGVWKPKSTNNISSKFSDIKEKTAKTKEKLKKYKGIAIHNDSENIDAQLSSNGIDKMTSGKAISKTIKNGFTADDHFNAVVNIVNLFKNAKLFGKEKDKNNTPEIKEIKRFVAQDKTKDGQDIDVLITVKEYYEHGHKLYSLEVGEINKVSHVAAAYSNKNYTHTTGNPNNSIPQNIKKSICFFKNSFNLKV